MNTTKKTGAEKAVVAEKVDTSKMSVEEKRLLKLKQLKAKTKKQAQLIKSAQKAEMKKSCMPIGKAILQKSSELKVEVNVLDAVNYFSAGLILIKMARSLKAKGREEFIAMAERNSNNDSETIAFLKRVVQIEVPHTSTNANAVAAALAKKVQEFQIEPDNEEIPY